jgi:hypothetical protein
MIVVIEQEDHSTARVSQGMFNAFEAVAAEPECYVYSIVDAETKSERQGDKIEKIQLDIK